jgi:hypothetical protein
MDNPVIVNLSVKVVITMTQQILACCPSCNLQVWLPQDAVGQTGTCTACQTRFVIYDQNNSYAMQPSTVKLVEPEGNPLEEAFSTACYSEIMPHLETLNSSSDTNYSVSLMEAHHYRGFADNAIRSLSGLAVEIMKDIFSDQVALNLQNHPAISDFVPNFGYQAEVRKRLEENAQHFYRQLQHYEQLIMGYRYKLQEAGGRAEDQGYGWGMIGAVIGGALLGPFGAMVGGAGAGYFGGSLIDSELDSDAANLNSVFQGMLGEYDNAMKRMIDLIYQFVGNYQHSVEEAIASISGRQKVFPF